MKDESPDSPAIACAHDCDRNWQQWRKGVPLQNLPSLFAVTGLRWWISPVLFAAVGRTGCIVPLRLWLWLWPKPRSRLIFSLRSDDFVAEIVALVTEIVALVADSATNTYGLALARCFSRMLRILW